MAKKTSTSAAPRRRTTPRTAAAPPDTSAASHSAPLPAPVAVAADSKTGVSNVEPTQDQIAEAAYQRYLQRGGQHGQDFDDWLEAERALKTRRP